MVLLPSATLLGLTPEQLEAVIAHELAHIKRYDYLVNMLQMLVETLLFYHPAVWWLSARIRHERELCCDDLAVDSCGDALCYARALTRLERLRISAPAAALGSTGGRTAVSHPAAARRSRSRWRALAAGRSLCAVSGTGVCGIGGRMAGRLCATGDSACRRPNRRRLYRLSPSASSCLSALLGRKNGA